MRRTVVFALVLAVGVVFGVMADRTLTAQQASIKRTMLFKHDITGFPGHEVVILEVVTPPGMQSGWHHHPGEEFAYAEEGDALAEFKGQPSIPFKPGMVSYRGVAVVHNTKNTGTTPTKGLAIYILEKGMPLAIPDKPPQ